MKKIRIQIGLLVCFGAARVWAEVPVSTSTPHIAAPVSIAPTPVVVSTATAENPAVMASTSPSVALTGETVSLPAPAAMTERSGPGVFVTLTRTAYDASALPTNAEVITPAMFRSYDAQNAGEALSHQTSIETLPVGRLGSLLTARVRGANSAQTLVLLDGRPVEGFSLGVADLSEIPIEQIDHIEVVRGGSSALYGPNAMGGVINVITKRAQYHGLPISHVGYEGGSYGRQAYKLDFGSRVGPVDFFFFGDQKWESGFRDNSDARQYNIGGNLGLSMKSAGKLLFDIGSYHANAGVPGQSCDLSDPFCTAFPRAFLQPNRFNDKDEKLASSPTARQITDTNYLRSSYLLPLPMDSLLTMRLFGMQREVDFDDAADPNLFNQSSADRHEQSKGGEAQLSLPWGLLFGTNFIHDREDSVDRIAPANSFTHFVEDWGLFGQDTFHYGVFTLIPSGRFDHNSQAGNTSNPRVQVLADATPWLRFSSVAARSFRAPTIDDLYFKSPFFNGNPDLRPEKAWSYDVGFEIHPDSFTFKATYFRANVNDLIQVKPITFDTVVNVGQARRQGLEVEIGHVVNKYFRDSWNYTYLENVGVPPGFDHYVSLAFSPRNTLNHQATITLTKNWSVDSTIRFEDSRYSGNDQTGVKMGSQVLWDLRFAYQLRQLEAFVGANDLTNKRYVEQPGYSLPGRTFFGGVNLRLWG